MMVDLLLPLVSMTFISAQSMNKQRNRRTQRRDRHVNESSLQQTTISFITATIGIEPPPDIAIPVSGVWAELAQDLQQDPIDEDIQIAHNYRARERQRYHHPI